MIDYCPVHFDDPRILAARHTQPHAHSNHAFEVCGYVGALKNPRALTFKIADLTVDHPYLTVLHVITSLSARVSL
ncbi:MAG TPA: hypothetical protein VGN95_17075 [Pyrinomonadaceae bacterium]|nr:hypothetical protein [Pyrinomonadaceae bacterium]